MSITQTTGRAIVLGPEDGGSFWQPVPANGFVRNLLIDDFFARIGRQKKTGQPALQPFP